ncbi:ABC transporter substrate-binding protein [Neorhizobium sp. DT-125]|uniref:ABC transporter substrate-binding protein n=1 Tax=Neorhizobium sp. DT-125 TaxID=3396163 RepID=UPI003F1D3144
MTRKLSIAMTVVLAAGLTSSVSALAQGKSYSGTTIRVLTTNQPWDVELQRRAKAFEDKTGAKVEFDMYALTQTAQKVAVELASKSPAYDVVWVESSDIARFAPGKFIEPLTAQVKDDANYNLADLIPSTVKGFSYKDDIYGLPHFAATQILYYRGDLLKEAGISGPPRTFDEFVEDCKKLQKPGLVCTAMRGKPSTSENVWYWTQMFLSDGAKWVKNYPDDMTPTVNSPQAIKALEFYVDLMKNYSIPGSVSASYDEVVVAMQQGQIAMAIEGAPLAGRILDPSLSKVAGKLGFAVPPGGPAGTFAPFTAQGMSINAASKNKEAATEFLKWATTRETMLDIAANSSFVAVTRSSVWDDPAFKQKHGYDFGFGSFTEAYANTLRTADENYRLPIPEFRPMGDRVALALQEVATGKRSAKEALDAAQGDIEKMFRRANYIK